MSTHPQPSASVEIERIEQKSPLVDGLSPVFTIRDTLANHSPITIPDSDGYYTPPSTFPDSPERLELHRVAEHLIEIANSRTIHKKVLEVSTEEAEMKNSRIERLESRLDNLKTSVSQVVGFYLVFQGVMITVTAQSPVLRKDNVWIPMVLSGVAAGSCCFPVWQKGWEIAHMRGDMHDEKNAREVALILRTELRRVGTRYDFATARILRQQISKKLSKYAYFRPYFLITVFIVLFTALILYCQWRIRS